MTMEHKDWRREDDIVECNRQMLQRQLACDVHFRVSDAQLRHGAHKYMLISRSHVFAAMFCGSLQEDESKDIDVPDVESAAFGELLRYIYTGSAELDADNVLPVLYAANKYDISGLARACVGFVEDRLDVDNACALLEQAHLFEEHDFRSRVLELILIRGEEVLESGEVAELCHQCLVDVVASDNLICREEQVLETLDRWAGRECERRGLEMTDANRRIMLGPALYHARLPLLDPKIFVERVVPRALLSEEEKVDIMRHFLVPTKGCELFSSQPRRKEKHRRFNRFVSRNPRAWNNKSGDNAISFMANHDVHVEGFTIYGTCRGGGQVLKVKAALLDSAAAAAAANTSSDTDANADVSALASVTCDVTTTSDVDVYDVMFPAPQLVSRGVWYTLTADIGGGHTYAGQEGRQASFDGRVVFTFADSEKSQTGTGVDHGQLPGLLYTL